MWYKKLWSMIEDNDWLIIALPGLLLIMFLWLVGQFFLLGLVVSFALVTLVWEFICVKLKDLSISDEFGKFKKENPIKAWVIITLIAATVWGLIVHFGVR